MIVAILGTLVFQVVDNDFQSFELNNEFTYATHKKLDGKASLQQVGDDLNRIQFDLVFHRRLIDPEDAIVELRELASQKIPLPFVFGEIYKGQWVITSIKEKPIKIHYEEDTGTVAILEVSVELLEFAGGELREVQKTVNTNLFQFLS